MSVREPTPASKKPIDLIRGAQKLHALDRALLCGTLLLALTSLVAGLALAIFCGPAFLPCLIASPALLMLSGGTAPLAIPLYECVQQSAKLLKDLEQLGGVRDIPPFRPHEVRRPPSNQCTST